MHQYRKDACQEELTEKKQQTGIRDIPIAFVDGTAVPLVVISLHFREVLHQ